MNIVIVGQGAMGLLWYHHIQQLIESNSKYNNTKLHLLSSNSSSSCEQLTPYELYSFTDYNSVEHIGKIEYAKKENIQAADFFILCLKSFQISSAIKNMSGLLKKNASIVLAHNGMGTLSKLPKEIANKHNIYALLTTHGCLRSKPFTVTHTGKGSTDVGLLLGTNVPKKQRAVTELLNAALPSTEYHNDIKKKQWLKLAVNCVINPLTAINDVENGQINRIEYSKTIKALLEEVVLVANAESVDLDFGVLINTIEKVAFATAKNSSSMRCDVLANRMSEIDYINGYIHHLGLEHSIATPENTHMWKTVRSLLED